MYPHTYFSFLTPALLKIYQEFTKMYDEDPVCLREAVQMSKTSVKDIRTCYDELRLAKRTMPGFGKPGPRLVPKFRP